MNPFHYARATDAADALRQAGDRPGARFLGGGTNLVDLMRESIEQPDTLIDVTGLSRSIDRLPDGGVRIGGAAKNTAVASDRHIRSAYPMLSRAILAGASGQIRNMATVAGNLMQRTRCTYFYDEAARCNKRTPGAGCDALHGFNRGHAILGASPACVATHPSDMCVALAALDAVVHVEGPAGARRIPLVDFHRLPGERPYIDTELAEGELITAVDVPPLPMAARSTYRKARDRASYAFALVSVAAALRVRADGHIADVRIALGGVAHKPWRARRAEAVLRGAPASSAAFAQAAQEELAVASALRENGFKIELARRMIVAVLEDLNTGAAA